MVASGSQAQISVFGLTNGNYHWRARTIDSTGATSGWVSFGSNADDAADFVVEALSTICSANPGEPMGPVLIVPGMYASEFGGRLAKRKAGQTPKHRIQLNSCFMIYSFFLNHTNGFEKL